MAIRTILAALALETDDDPVARRAVQLATQHGAQLLVLHVNEGNLLRDPELPKSADQATIAQLLEAESRDRIQQLTESAPDSTRIFIESGKPHDLIRLFADRHGADLVLIGPGKAKNIRERVFGSTADRVVRAASGSVLVVKSADAQPYVRVVAGVDFSGLSRAAVQSVARLAPSAFVELLHTVEIPLAFEQAMRKAGTAPAEIERYRAAKGRNARARLLAEFSEAGRLSPLTMIRIVNGDPANALIRSSRRRKVDLIALGTRGLNAVAEQVLGSVARKVLLAASCDVLVVASTTS